MANIDKRFGEGGANLVPNAGQGKPTLAETLRDGADDFETLRAKFNQLLAKLDADAGVTDTNYASTLGVATGDIKTKKV